MRSRWGSSGIAPGAGMPQPSRDCTSASNSLTPREREIMALVVTGRLNKQIAGDLKVSEITVKVHRGQVMRKMRAKSLAELVRMADQLGVTAGGFGASKP